MTPVIETRGITKRFPGVLANDRVDFTLEKGEIHALLGENGAGKTTLMNMLYGLYQPDEGEILVNGEAVEFHDPNDAIRQGIGMVHQHFMLIPVMTVTENIILGVERTRPPLAFLGKLGRLDRRSARNRIRELAEEYGLAVDPNATIQDLPVGSQQRVEIVKTLYRRADILILDEPTAVLTPQEADELFVVMRRLVERGVSIVFISHKLKEVLAVADRISVLRNGRLVGTTTPAQATRESLAEMMVGREVLLTVAKEEARPGEPVLQVNGLRTLDDRDQVAVNNVSFEVRAGEILGIAGVQGNGQRELVEALTGLRPVEGGEVSVLGQDVTHASPRQITEIGVAYIPEDRQKHGLVLSYPVADNLVLNTYYRPPFAKRMVLNEPEIERHGRALVQEFDIRTPSIYTKSSSLSGGNQQKTIVARELSRPIKLLIAAQPTRGLDVGSTEFIHGRLVEQRQQGVAVLLISADLDEILSLSDRVAVVFEGEIVGTLPIADATRERVGLLMAGVKE
ncbi:MAG: ATP-binding cassette domain-containing protein [Ardenticatenales bacterium]|nr:ATP-binding cassette domain-containing protein [Ardenticatenales bacterium]